MESGRDYGAVLKATKKEECDLPSTCVRLWRPLTAVFFYWIMQWERSDLTGAFLRSRVACPTPVPNPETGLCPRGSVLVSGKGCTALPPGSHDWSGSSHCANKFLVVQRGMAIGGQMSSFNTVCQLFAQVFVGSMLVDTWGRKPVMLMGLGGSTVCTILFFLSCYLDDHVYLRAMFTGVALFSLTNAFPAAVLAMASDLSSTFVQRGISYTAIFVVQHLGILSAFVGGYFILALDLTDYKYVWWIFMCFCVTVVGLAALVLRETLSREWCLPVKKAPEAKAPLQEAGAAYRLVARDDFLPCSLALTFLGNLAMTGAINITGGYAISVVGLTQAVASLAGVFQPAAMVCGSSVSTWLYTHYGPFPTYFVGLSFVVLGYVITGLAASFHSAAESLFWAGWVAVGLGWGMAMPSHSAFNSQRVPDKNDHGKLFAAVNFVAAVGATIGSIIWTNYVFRRDLVETWMGGAGYFLSAIVTLGVAIGYAVLWLTVIRPEEGRASADEAAEATAPSRSPGSL